MSDVTLEQMMTLHRYFITASTMRRNLHRFVSENPGNGWGRGGPDDPEMFANMSVWYSTLYVVAEGWLELGMTDVTIDHLKQNPNFALLKRFRNATFHYQPDYFSKKHSDYIAAEDSVIWTYQLSDALGWAILRELNRLHTEQDQTPPSTSRS